MRHAIVIMMLAGCGERTLSSEEPPPPPPDVGAPAESEGESEGTVTCREGLLACDGKCVDPMTDDHHCGTCNWECRDAVRWGSCEQGLCPAILWCGEREQAFASCDDFCAYYDQRCVDEPGDGARGCGGGTHYLYYDEHDQFDDACIGIRMVIHGTCSTPIDWSLAYYGGSLPGGVECCCTQEPPQ